MSSTTERTTPFGDLWHDWLDELTSLLASPTGARSEARRVDRVAASIAATLADRPALCQLMASQAVRFTLFDPSRRPTRHTDAPADTPAADPADAPADTLATAEHLGRLAAVMLDAVPRLGGGAAARFASHLVTAVAGLWRRATLGDHAGDGAATRPSSDGGGRPYHSPAAFADEVEALCRDLLLGVVPRNR